MPELSRTSVKGKLFRKISKPGSEYCIFICSTFDTFALPSALRKDKGREYFTVTGNNLPAADGVEVEYYGTWITNKKYGIQFKADSYTYVKPSTEKGIKSFLKSKAFPGIGEKTADNIVNQFGTSTLNIIKNEPNKLLTVPGITPSKVGAIVNAYKRNESYSNLSVFLSQYGLSSESIIKVNDLLGSEAAEKIKENPYIIQGVRGIGFKTCDRIARGLNMALDSFERVRSGVLEVMKNHSLLTGDTCILISELEKEALRLLNEGLDSKPVTGELFRLAAKWLYKNGDIVFRDKKFAFLKEYDLAEELTAKVILRMLDSDLPVPGLNVISEVENYRKNADVMLTDTQAEAVKMALQSRISVITGGPGTGKTTILSAIIAVYKKLYPNFSITLLAPTGKAARRMAEVTKEAAHTIHSKLGIFDSGAYQEPTSIAPGLIIVDESSMVDAILISKLLEAVRANSQIVFIGDADQLPSVAAGAVLSDMIGSNIIPVMRLTEIFRQKQGGIIVQNAMKINSGLTDLTFNEEFQFLDAKSEYEALEIIKKVYADEVSSKGIDNVALLSPLRRTQNGRFTVVSDNLNRELQNVINPRRADCFTVIGGTEYRVGDRVLQWKNTEQSSNGDTGVILSIGVLNEDTALKIHWDNGSDTIETRSSMANISLAYAISIHKSQGSEYASVIIPLLKNQQCQLFKRNLLYTAVTRAKEKCIIIGDKEMIDCCTMRCDADKRMTLLKERLQRYS